MCPALSVLPLAVCVFRASLSDSVSGLCFIFSLAFPLSAPCACAVLFDAALQRAYQWTASAFASATRLSWLFLFAPFYFLALSPLLLPLPRAACRRVRCVREPACARASPLSAFFPSLCCLVAFRCVSFRVSVRFSAMVVVW